MGILVVRGLYVCVCWWGRAASQGALSLCATCLLPSNLQGDLATALFSLSNVQEGGTLGHSVPLCIGLWNVLEKIRWDSFSSPCHLLTPTVCMGTFNSLRAPYHLRSLQPAPEQADASQFFLEAHRGLLPRAPCPQAHITGLVTARGCTCHCLPCAVERGESV